MRLHLNVVVQIMTVEFAVDLGGDMCNERVINGVKWGESSCDTNSCF